MNNEQPCYGSLHSGWGSPFEHGVFPTKMDFLRAFWEKLDFMRTMGKNAPFCMHYWKKWTFVHSPHCQGHIPWENFWKIWLKIMHLETLWPNYIPILIFMIKTCSKSWTILDILGPWEHHSHPPPGYGPTYSHLELPWTPNKPIRWVENMTSWICHGDFNATFA